MYLVYSSNGLIPKFHKSKLLVNSYLSNELRKEKHIIKPIRSGKAYFIFIQNRRHTFTDNCVNLPKRV